MKTVLEIIQDVLFEEGYNSSYDSEKHLLAVDKNIDWPRIKQRLEKFGIYVKGTPKVINPGIIKVTDKFNHVNWEETNPFFMPLWGTYKKAIPFDKIKPEHIDAAIQRYLDLEEEEFNKVLSNPATPTFQNTLAIDTDLSFMEEDGREHDLPLYVLSLYLNSMSSKELEAIEEKYVEARSELSHKESTSKAMYERVKAISRKRLQPNQIRLLDQSLEGFKRSGVALGDEDKEKLKDLEIQLEKNEIEYGRRVREATNAVWKVITDEAELDGVPQDAIDRFKKKSGEGEGWTVTLGRTDVTDILENATSRELRKEIYLAYENRCTSGEYDTRDLVKDIVNLRIQIAKLLDYPCHSDLVTGADRMLQTRDIIEFLDSQISTFLPMAKENVAELKEYSGLDDFNAWDIAYYKNQLQKEKFNLDQEELKKYFKIDDVINAMTAIFNKYFGFMAYDASKVFKDPEKRLPVYDPSVRPFVIQDWDTGKVIGIVYLDLFMRENKKPGAWCETISEQYESLYCGRHSHRPLVSINLNLAPGSTNMYLGEVETLFHEFGHGLQELFSQCDLRCQSGTHVAWDYVELASQVMENFVKTREFLSKFRKDDNESISEETIKTLKDIDAFMGGIWSIRQLRFGKMDMIWHTLEEPFEGDVVEFEKQHMKDICEFEYNQCFSTNITHLFAGGYDAGYYGYRWAEVMDADAFSAFTDVEATRRFKKTVLASGDTEDPMALFIKFMGRLPNTDALLKRYGKKI